MWEYLNAMGYQFWKKKLLIFSQWFIYVIDPLTAGAEYIRFFIFLSAHYVPPLKHVKDKMWHQSARLKRIDIHFVKS